MYGKHLIPVLPHVYILRLEMEAIHRFPIRSEVRHFMHPDCLKYQNLRTIIDCIEFFIETPSSLTAQRGTWSAYKSHNTLKVQGTKSIAETRIRVECLIGRIKIYHILDGALPLSLYSVAEDIIHICAYLTKFQSPVLAQLNQNFDSAPVAILSAKAPRNLLSAATRNPDFAKVFNLLSC